MVHCHHHSLVVGSASDETDEGAGLADCRADLGREGLGEVSARAVGVFDEREREGESVVYQKGEQIEVTVTIKNTGSRAGKEVAQVYVTAPKGQLEKPAKELKTFGKTRELQPGESQTLKMTLQRRDLASFDESQSAWVVDAGNYEFKVGASVADIRTTTTLKVAALTEKTSNALAPQQELKRLKY